MGAWDGGADFAGDLVALRIVAVGDPLPDHALCEQTIAPVARHDMKMHMRHALADPVVQRNETASG